METTPIKDKANLVRDINSKALLNTNTNALRQYEEQKRRFEQNQEIATEVSTLKQEMQEIKTLLLTLLGNKTVDHSNNIQ